MNNEIIFYATPEGNKKVEVVFQNEDFWLSQKRIAELFGVEVSTVNYHLKEIFKNGELIEDSVIRKIQTTAATLKVNRESDLCKRCLHKCSEAIELKKEHRT